MGMGWRNHTTHREETKAVKTALTAAGIPFRKVGHGTGTAWSWLDIYLNGIDDYQLYWRQTLDIAEVTTGRHGDCRGEIMVHQ